MGARFATTQHLPSKEVFSEWDGRKAWSTDGWWKQLGRERASLLQLCIQSLLSPGCTQLLLSLLLNISPKFHHLRNTEFLLLSALFWLQKQSLTVKLSNKAKAAGIWQQSTDPGTDQCKGSCVSCSGRTMAIVRNRQVVAAMHCRQCMAENRACSPLTHPGQTQHSWGKTKSLFRSWWHVYMLTLHHPSLFLINAAFRGNEEIGCKSVEAHVGELLPQHILHSAS